MRRTWFLAIFWGLLGYGQAEETPVQGYRPGITVQGHVTPDPARIDHWLVYLFNETTIVVPTVTAGWVIDCSELIDGNPKEDCPSRTACKMCKVVSVQGGTAAGGKTIPKQVQCTSKWRQNYKKMREDQGLTILTQYHEHDAVIESGSLKGQKKRLLPIFHHSDPGNGLYYCIDDNEAGADLSGERALPESTAEAATAAGEPLEPQSISQLGLGLVIGIPLAVVIIGIIVWVSVWSFRRRRRGPRRPERDLEYDL